MHRPLVLGRPVAQVFSKMAEMRGRRTAWVVKMAWLEWSRGIRANGLAQQSGSVHVYWSLDVTNMEWGGRTTED